MPELTLNTEDYRVKPGKKVHLARIESKTDGGIADDDGDNAFEEVIEELQDLQNLMFAEHKHSLLVVLQAMDAAGKDSTIRHVFGPINPQGVRVWNFKGPTDIEREHDYLWRIHEKTPRDGYISVFNRSHYEDVLVVRVKNLVPEDVWTKRYDHINAFERMLVDEGTSVLKFYLHISKDYQKKRLQRRLDRPDKHWKFNPADLEERARWDDYRKAFEEAISQCSTEAAPWYVIPSEVRWFRNLLIATIVRDTMKGWDMKFPEPTFDPKTIVID